jgi:hypothetical protein
MSDQAVVSWLVFIAAFAVFSALNYFAYNFIKIRRTLRMSPAMAAGATDRLGDVNDFVAFWESYERRGKERRSK